MKININKYILMSFFIFLVSLNISSVYAQSADLQIDNQFYYSMDSQDISGSTYIDDADNFNATLINDATSENGILGEAIGFSGTGDYLLINHNSAFISTDFTLGYWIKAEAMFGYIFFKDVAGNNNGDFNTAFENTKTYLDIQTGGTTCRVSADVDAGSWHHVIMVKDGLNMSIYINATRIDSTSCSANMGLNTENINIGSFAGSTQYQGDIDELFYSTRAWNETEISESYNSGLGFNFWHAPAESTFSISAPVNGTIVSTYNYSILNITSNGIFNNCSVFLNGTFTEHVNLSSGVTTLLRDVPTSTYNVSISCNNSGVIIIDSVVAGVCRAEFSCGQYGTCSNGIRPCLNVSESCGLPNIFNTTIYDIECDSQSIQAGECPTDIPNMGFLIFIIMVGIFCIMIMFTTGQFGLVGFFGGVILFVSALTVVDCMSGIAWLMGGAGLFACSYGLFVFPAMKEDHG